MDIRINKLTLHNFKGVRDNTISPGGACEALEGRNGSGKSTFFDAFTWLLFGKDHRGQDWTNFDIKPIDPVTQEPFHHLEHWVEAELAIDGTRKVLRRTLTENWVKPRGQAEEVLKGHTQAFAIDGIPCSTKRDYDTAVAQWISEDIFRVVTNPLYLIDDRYTNWMSRRTILLSLAGEVDLTGIRARFKEVIDEANGTPLEVFRKKITADRKACKSNLSTAQNNIKAWTSVLPEAIDVAAVTAEKERIEAEAEAKISDIKAEIADIDAAVLNANEAVGKIRARINDKARQIRELEEEQEALVRRGVQAAARIYEEELAAWNDSRNKAAAAEQVIREEEDKGRRITGLIAELRKEEQVYIAQLRVLGEKYAGERDAAFSYPDRCPECGQPLPDEYLDARRGDFEERRRRRLEAYKDEGRAVKDCIETVRGRISEAEAELDKGAEIVTAAERQLGKIQNEAISRPVQPDYDKISTTTKSGTRYAEIGAKIAVLKKECAELADNNPADLAGSVTSRAAKDAEIASIRKECKAACEPLVEQIAQAKERERMEGMIADEEASVRRLADELARLERLEFSAAELAKAEIDAQTDAVNGLFRVARWKMFDYTIDGGAVETCEVLSPASVPFRSMNDAMRVQAGMDVIRTVGERYGITAPIFIDNAESVLQDSFDTTAQVIRLVVRNCDLREVRPDTEAIEINQ